MKKEILSPKNPAFLDVFLKYLPYPIFICNKKGIFKYVNPSFENYIGIPFKDILNKKYDFLLEKDHLETVKKSIENVLKNEKMEVFQVKIKSEKEGFIHARIHIFPFKSGDKVLGFIGIARNITKRLLVEEELNKIGRKYEELIENLPVGVYRTTPEGEFILANKALINMFGFETFEELSKLNLERNGYHPDNPREIFKKLMEEKGELKNYEAKWRKKGGEVIYIRENAKAVKDEKGNIVYYEGIVEDITKEKEAEEKLIHRTKELQAIFSAIPDLFFRIDKNGVILDYLAGNFGDLYKKPEEFLGKNLIDLFPEPLNKNFINQIKTAIEKNRIEIIEYDLEIEREKKYFESRIIPISKEEVIGVVRNITSRKLWESQLKESEARFRTIAENALVGVYIRDDKFLYVNPAFCKIFNYTPEEIIGKMSPKDLTYEEDLDSISINIEDRLKDEEKEKIEAFRGKRKDGKIVYLECYSTLIELLGRKAVLGVLLDVTEKREAEEKQKEYNLKLNKLLDGIILAMAKIVEVKDPYTAGHQQRVAELAVKIGKKYGLDEEKLQAIQVAAMIHDIGKIHVPAEILTKPGELSPLEREMIQNHPTFGYEILKSIEFPWPIAQIVLQHHEKIDGSGYPLHLKGDQIMIEAKIISVADVVEAMSTHRPYRAGYGLARALDEIISHCGTWYDEKVVNICLNLFKEKDFEFNLKV